MAGANRREAELAAACRTLVRAYARGAKDGGAVNWEDVDDAYRLALAALGVKPGGPRAASVVEIDIRGGAIQNIRAPRGISAVVRDWDDCPECGGLECGHNREAVHGPDCEREARLKNRGGN